MADKLHNIEFAFTHDGFRNCLGYNVGDWFHGGWLTIEQAELAQTTEEAEMILRTAYRGADIYSVGVEWSIN